MRYDLDLSVVQAIREQSVDLIQCVQHGNLIGTPAAATSALRARESVMPKWKMLAARAASAFPARKTSAKCAAEPAARRASGLRASMATMTAWAPKLLPISAINSGRAIAEELMLTLSAPALKTAAASAPPRA